MAKSQSSTTPSHLRGPYGTSTNYSLLSIPASYLLAFPPHMYMFYRGMTASNYAATNILPRTNLDILKDKLPTATWQSLQRARGAHLNALEGFPLFAASMLAANLPSSRLSQHELNFYAAEYMVSRVIYTGLYMTMKSEASSYLRSAVYVWSLAIPGIVLWKVATGRGERVFEEEKGKSNL